MAFSTQPQSFYFDSIQALLNWKPSNQAYSNFNISGVPLRLRPATGSRALLQDCSDYKGGYVSNADLWPQGSSDADTYNFSFWQYMDNFCYFAHHRISLPTTWWTNAAHLNGISVMGTVIFEGGSGSDLKQMLNDPKSISQLVALSQYYGFDGWFFNVEVGFPPGITYTNMTSFLSSLRQALKAVNPNALVIWYDSVTTSGSVDYQNCLDAANNPFFVASNGIFTNYWWPQNGSLIRGSVNQANADGRSPFDVYTGVDVWARGTYYQPGYGNPPNDSVSAAGVCVTNGTSVGLYAPGWTFETAPGTGETQHQNFEKQDTLFWIGKGYGSGSPSSTDCIAQSIPARPAAAGLPFATNFDTGRGLQMSVRGARVSNLQWSNLSLQGMQPTYRFFAVSGKGNVFTASINQSVAYDGGACLTVAGSGAGAQDSVSYRLNDLSMPVTGPVQIQAVFQPIAAGSAYPSVRIGLVFSDGTSYVTSTAPVQQGPWWTLTETMSGNLNKTITQLVLTVGPSVGGQTPGSNYGVNVGQISLNAATQAPATVSNLAVKAIYSSDTAMGALLTWNYPAGGARFFDVWQVNRGNYQWLVRVCANTAWLGGLTAVGGSGTFTFAVQPVNFGLIPQPQNACATAILTINPMQFDDGPTISLVGNPVITAMTVCAGNILNAVQATNGAYALPQHGDTSGTANTITLDSGDVITGVSGKTGTWFGWNCVVQIQFTTRNGKTYGPYGSMFGVTSSTPFSTSAPAGQSILAFSGSLVNVPLAGGSRVNIIQSLQVTTG